nr:MAG TPA: hypothetical protein [Caudoviricetes sp.]
MLFLLKSILNRLASPAINFNSLGNLSIKNLF